MAIVLDISPALEVGTCYTLTGKVTEYSAGTITFTADDGVTTQTIGSVSALGGFSLDFTATAEHTELEWNDLFGAVTKNLSLNMGTACLQTLCSECFDLAEDHACCLRLC